MEPLEFDLTLSILRKAQDKVLAAKGADYAEGYTEETDRLANFKLVADMLQGAPVDAVTIAAVYWLKHVIAIAKAIRERTPGSEPLLGRFVDEGNYNALLLGCFAETNPELVPEVLGPTPTMTKTVPNEERLFSDMRRHGMRARDAYPRSSKVHDEFQLFSDEEGLLAEPVEELAGYDR